MIKGLTETLTLLLLQMLAVDVSKTAASRREGGRVERGRGREGEREREREREYP